MGCRRVCLYLQPAGLPERQAGSMPHTAPSQTPSAAPPQDSEGFLGPSTPAAAAHNPYSCAGSGCDFAAEAALPAIDFASCHLYPELWLPQADGQVRNRKQSASWLGWGGGQKSC